MKKNVGTADRVIRILLAATVGALMLTGTITGAVAVIAAVLAVVFLLTGAVSFCPLYALLRVSSCRKDASVPEHV